MTLNTTLHQLLSVWLAMGNLQLERITWQTSCDLLQKVGDFWLLRIWSRAWWDTSGRSWNAAVFFIPLHCASKNMPTLTSCSFVKHGLISIIFGKQHQHTFRNYMHILLSLSLHLCLLYLLLNNCNGNDAKHDAFSSVDCWLCAQRAGWFYFSRCSKWCPLAFTRAHNCF